MSTQENIQTVKDIYAAFDRGDIDVIINSLADDVDWGHESAVSNDVPWYGIYKGPAAVRARFFGSIAAEVTIDLFERKDFVASGNHVCVTYRTGGTFKKHGKLLDFNGMHFWTFNDSGKVSFYRGYDDTASKQRLGHATPQLSVAAWHHDPWRAGSRKDPT